MLTAQLQLQQVKLFQDSIPVKEDLFILALLFIRGLPQMYELQVWTHIVCIFEKNSIRVYLYPGRKQIQKQRESCCRKGVWSPDYEYKSDE